MSDRQDIAPIKLPKSDNGIKCGATILLCNSEPLPFVSTTLPAMFRPNLLYYCEQPTICIRPHLIVCPTWPIWPRYVLVFLHYPKLIFLSNLFSITYNEIHNIYQRFNQIFYQLLSKFIENLIFI